MSIVNFDKYIDDNNWKEVNDHYRSFPQELQNNIVKTITDNSKNVKVFRQKLESSYQIKGVDLDIQKELKTDLYGGNAIGVDGTCAEYDLISGFQALIGIVGVTYSNKKLSYTSYVSEPFIPDSNMDAQEQIKFLVNKKPGGESLTPSHVRAIMLWKERSFALSRHEKYKFVQGDIMPYELKTGQGKLRGLRSCLDLGRKLLSENNIVAVQGTTSKPELRWCGYAMRSGEYIQLYDYAQELQLFLDGDPEKGKSPAHFAAPELAAFRDFIDEIKGKFAVGMYKLKNRAYVFYASKKNFDTMANLVFLDSSNQPLRGFPLILDYADIVAARLIAAGDFKKIVETKIARFGNLELEINERELRRR